MLLRAQKNLRFKIERKFTVETPLDNIYLMTEVGIFYLSQYVEM